MTPPLEAQPKTSTGRSKAVSYKRSHLIPTDVHYVIRDKRLNTIYRELRSIDLSGHRNAVAVLFRVFVELSIELYLEKHVIPYNDNDKLAKKQQPQ